VVRLCGASAQFLATLALVVSIGAAPAWAQTGTAALYGKVADQQGGALPGVTVSVTSNATGVVRSTTTDSEGNYQLLALPPGGYSLKIELTGFRTAVHPKVELPVDHRTRLDVPMELGSVTETVEVTSLTSVINTTDASLGNVISGNQVRELPLEARNVVGLLSLQAGAVYLPNVVNTDPRSGSVNGARADQSNVTLDGVDVNDPQFGTAYSSALRVTLDALQEFRVTTSNYSADAGRSSAAQVSLVTRSGTNDFHGSGYWVQRDTKFSSNEYFLKLAQLRSGQPSEAPKLDKRIGGGSLGGPVLKERLFFFGNVEILTELSETPVLRSVPSETMRDGVLLYRCTNPSQCPGGSVAGATKSFAVPAGFFGLGPAELRAIDPLGIGVSQGALDIFRKYPVPNDPGRDAYNIVGYRFASPIENDFKTYIGRVDYRMTSNQTVFGRFNLQDDAVAAPQQFPGQAPNTTRQIGSNGFAVGHDWVLGATKVNTFRYGYTRIKEDVIGLQTESRVSFRFIDDYEALTSTNGRETPTHNFVNDFNWIKGNHTLKMGTNLRFSRIPRYTNAQSFLGGVTNASWMLGVGRRYMPGSTQCGVSQAVCNSLPAVISGFQASYADSFAPILGIVSQTNLRANYNVDGSLVPVGEPVARKYGSDEYEFYVQDQWKLGDNLTVTAGLRYSLFSPPWEVNGQQVAPSIDLGELFAMRDANMRAGIPDNRLPLITFDLAGPVNNKPGYYDWDKNNFAPRFAVAWTPKADGGLFGWLTGGDRMVIRGGYSVVYDRIGQALATQFDTSGAFGLSTSLNSPANRNNEDNPAIRFQAINVLPPTVPAAPPGGFPQTPPSGAAVITQALDSSIRTPYAHSFNVVVGRELGNNYSLEAAYVGRLGRNLLVRRDMMMPLSLVDPKSGMDYYTAVGLLIREAEAKGASGVGPIPYWENLWPGAAGGGLTATQNMAATFMANGPDWITALWEADEFCSPSCSTFGNFAYFNRQYDSLAAQSSLGRSEYNALQLSVRKRWSDAYQFDVNYTFAHSLDHGSAIERGSAFTAFGNGGYTGFLIDSWDQEKQWGNSDFDVRHQVNVNWIADLPFGRGKPMGTNAPGWLNAVIGEWAISGVWRMTSGFPFNVQNCRSCWATNWNLQGNAELVDPGVLPPTGTTRNAVSGNPSPFVNPVTAIGFFRRALPGESGLRNELRGDGYFSIDFSLSKSWTMPWSNNHRVRFRWDTFNLTNTPRFNTGAVDMIPDIASTFGRYNGVLATCDGGAGRCMQFALRYEF
jgi:Carboxypeptidase regulatory-like domain/TonB dependent receptor